MTRILRSFAVFTFACTLGIGVLGCGEEKKKDGGPGKSKPEDIKAATQKQMLPTGSPAEKEKAAKAAGTSKDGAGKNGGGKDGDSK